MSPGTNLPQDIILRGGSVSSSSGGLNELITHKKKEPGDKRVEKMICGSLLSTEERGASQSPSSELTSII